MRGFLEATREHPAEVRGLFAALGQRVTLLAQNDRVQAQIGALESEKHELAARNEALAARVSAAELQLGEIMQSASWRGRRGRET